MIAIVWNDELKIFDFVDEDGLLAEDNGLYTAIFESLFSDALDPDESKPVYDRRGYWGDVFTPGVTTGSLLYRLRAEPYTSQSFVFAADWAESSLVWMVSEGVAKSVTASAEPLSRDSFRLTVVIVSTDDARFETAWAVTRAGGVNIYGV